MNSRLFFLVCAAGAVLSPCAAFDGTDVTSDPVTFRMYVTGDSVYSLASAAEVAAWPVTWRAGATVTATAMDGTANTLATDAAAAGSAALPQSKGGVWSLANSLSGSAALAVPWTVFDDGGTLSTSDVSGLYAIDTVQDGPDRKSKKSEVLPVAYSGDNWAGDLAKAATVTFTPPEDSGLEPTTLNRTGQGAETFTFNAFGVWTVTLTFADGTTREARINLHRGGLIISFH